MRTVTVAATQMACGLDEPANIAQAEALVRKAAAQGAQIVLCRNFSKASTSVRMNTRMICTERGQPAETPRLTILPL